MKALLLLALFPLLLFSCKRLDGDTLVEGKVVDKHTGDGIANAWVEVYESRGGSWGGYSFVKKHQAKANGDFGFQFEGKGDDYLLRAYTDLGHSTNWNDAISIRQGKNNKNLKLKVDAPAWVRINIINKPPIEVAPQIHMRGGFHPDQNGLSYINLDNWVRDTSIIQAVDIGTSAFIWRLRSVTGEYITHTEQINYIGLDTTEVTIEF